MSYLLDRFTITAGIKNLFFNNLIKILSLPYVVLTKLNIGNKWEGKSLISLNPGL